MPDSPELNALRRETTRLRLNAQGGFRLGVEGIISEIRRFADAAEQAIGEISIDEAFTGIERTVVERCQQLRGER